MGVRSSVKKKLDRQERYCKFSAAQSPLPGPSNLEDDDTASPSSNSSGDVFHTAAFTPKRPTVNPTIPKDILNSKLVDADHLPRCDYKEYLELAKLFLGEKITRKNGFIFHLSRPGADHHARWMRKAIYVLKMVLLQHQLPDLHWQTKKKMALFVVFVYLRPWFTASGLSSAAQNDLLFCKSLAKYKKINTGVSSKTLAVLNRHTWYLTEDLIPTDFLITAEWTQSAEYETAKQALKSLSTTNDSAERAIALAVNYNTKIKRDEESYQELLQVVEYHRNTFGYRTKKDLKTFY